VVEWWKLIHNNKGSPKGNQENNPRSRVQRIISSTPTSSQCKSKFLPLRIEKIDMRHILTQLLFIRLAELVSFELVEVVMILKIEAGRPFC